MRRPEPATILYVEDDPDDRLLAEMAHRESGAESELVFVGDALEALEYLRRTGRHAARPRSGPPALILLDLNMPGVDGREALVRIKADRGLHRIPVVILTTSGAPEDVAWSYDAGANSYVIKPASFAILVHLFDCLSDYWCHLAAAPGLA